MKKRFGKSHASLLFSIFFLFIAEFSPLNAAESVEKSLEFLKNSTEFRTSTQNLSTADGHIFPHNIIVTIPSSSDRPREAKSTRTVAFLFPREYAAQFPQETLLILRTLKELSLPYTLEAVFCANVMDFNGLSPSPYGLSGAEVYAESCEQTENLCAIIFLPPEDTRRIISGSASDTSPAYLVRTLANACSWNGEEFRLPRSYGSLYKMGVYPSHHMLDAFLSREIASAAITLSTPEKDIDIITAAAGLLSRRGSLRWDRHYTFIPLGTNGIWPGEIFYIFTFIIIAGIIIFGFSLSPFFVKSRHNAVRKDFMRSWYFLPAQIALTTLMLLLANLIFKFLSKTPEVFLSAKAFLALTVLFAHLWLVSYHRFRISFPALGYQMELISAFNLITALCLDITLLFPFILEYVIVWLFRRTRTIPALIVEMLLLFMPFFLPMHEVLRFGSQDSLYTLFKGTFWTNFSLALFLSPVITLWQRIVILTMARRKEQALPLAKRVRQLCADVLSSSIPLCAALFLVTLIMQGPGSKGTEGTGGTGTVRESAQRLFSMSCNENEFMGLRSHHLQISPKEGVYRCLVTLRGNGEENLPVYESNYSFVHTEDSVQFCIPDEPQGTMSIIFSSDTETSLTVTAEAWAWNEDERCFEHHTENLLIEGND